MNHKKIKELISKVPLCKDGQDSLTSILKELGYKPPASDKYKVGEVYVCGSPRDHSNFMLIGKDETCISLFHSDTDAYDEIAKCFTGSNALTFYAKNVDLALKKFSAAVKADILRNCKDGK